MNWLILNGSPKGELSVTMQSMKYLEKTHREDHFEYIHVVKELNTFEAQQDKLEALGRQIHKADAVIWAFPLYHMLVHAAYKRFIELIFENQLEPYFQGKVTGVFSTSIHFYDHTAHNYMHGICDDLGMHLSDALSHDMDDLNHAFRRKELDQFFENIQQTASENWGSAKLYYPLGESRWRYDATMIQPVIKTQKQITILTDATPHDHNLNQMISRYQASVDQEVHIANLNEWKARGHCLGCCQCAFENRCVYHDKDDYRQKLDAILEHSDILIFAGRMHDRYLSSRFKWFFDRSFCYTHTPIYGGKQMGFMISGPLSRCENLKQILEAYVQMDGNLIGFISDECEDQTKMDENLTAFAKRSVYYSESHYQRTSNFLGVGALKIFRDAVAGHLGAIFTEDYRYYKKHNMLAFPSYKERIQAGLMRYFMGKKRFQNEVRKKMIHFMIKPHLKTLEKLGLK